MIEWIILGLVVAAMVFLLRSKRQSTIQEYCDLECKDCEGCRR